MESRAKVAGHAIHPLLIVFPLGLLAMALVFDIIFAIGGHAGFAVAAFWDIAAGVIMGLVAAAFGFWDWLAIPVGTRAKRLGRIHGIGNVVVVVLFAVSWLLRLHSPGYQPSSVGFVLEIIAVLLAGLTGWLGGELVERLGVGVDPGANLDAPSSLSGAIPRPPPPRPAPPRPAPPRPAGPPRSPAPAPFPAGRPPQSRSDRRGRR